MHRKATEIRALEEERFLTEQRRKAAQDRFFQEKTVGEAVEERRQILAAARVSVARGVRGEILSLDWAFWRMIQHVNRSINIIAVMLGVALHTVGQMVGIYHVTKDQQPVKVRARQWT